MVEWGMLLSPGPRSWLESLTTPRMGGLVHYNQFRILCPMEFHGSRSMIGGSIAGGKYESRGALEARTLERSLILVAATGHERVNRGPPAPDPSPSLGLSAALGGRLQQVRLGAVTRSRLLSAQCPRSLITKNWKGN